MVIKFRRGEVLFKLAEGDSDVRYPNYQNYPLEEKSKKHGSNKGMPSPNAECGKEDTRDKYPRGITPDQCLYTTALT